MEKNKIKKLIIIIILISILILILILIFFQFIKIDTHYFDTKFKALPGSLSLQGLECIREKNELFIISFQ